jgi:hypothetical protein
MDVYPRHPGLDQRLARDGSTEETLQVYGDWLHEHNHPLTTFIADARAGDEEARRRTLERRFALTERFPATSFRFCAGVVAGIELSHEWGTSPDADAMELSSEPLLQLLTSVRVDFSDQNGSGYSAVAALSAAPSSLGRLEIVDAYAHPEDEALELDHLEQPFLSDLRLRLGPLASLPKSLAALRRLELCARVSGLAWPALPALQELHLDSSVGEDTIRRLVCTPSLQVLGLHHQGTVPELLTLLSGIALPDGLTELAVAVPSVTSSDLDALAAFAPQVGLLRLPFVQVSAPLRPPFTGIPDLEHPIYVFS